MHPVQYLSKSENMIKAFQYWLWRVLPLPDFVRSLILWIANPKYLVAVDALVLDANKACLLFNHPYRQDFTWGLPGGYLKKGEHPEDAIRREIFEEAGLDIHIIRLLDIDLSADFPRISLIYLAELHGELAFSPSAEVTEARFFPADNLPKLFPNQKAIIQKHCK